MYAFRPSPRWLATTSSKATRRAIRETFAAQTESYDVPTVPTCPSPTCECADMPVDLDIDRTKDLNGTMAAYSEHVIITTGQADWKSKVEDERDTAPWGLLVSRLKSFLGSKGQFFDAYRNTVVSTSSFASPGPPSESRPQVMLFPSFQLVENVSTSEAETMSFIKSFILPNATQSSPNSVEKEKGQSEASATLTEWNGRVKAIDAPTILICSHNSRDSRCGVLGPLLHSEFEQYINKHHTLRNLAPPQLVSSKRNGQQEAQSFASHPTFRPGLVDAENGSKNPINVGMVSHIGGHKWAGNVIVYIPPGYQIKPVRRASGGSAPEDTAEEREAERVVHEDEPLPPEVENQAVSPLAGKGIWYGRVEPKHVEGIVEMTLGHGKIIRELFRGGIHKDGTAIRL